MGYDQQARLFRVLMHPGRLAILDSLREGEACVCHLEAVLGQRQAYTSQQLMVLREAELIQQRREGNRIYYRVAEPGIFALLDAARAFAGEPRPAAGQPAGCACPRCSSPAAVAEPAAA
jgi:ArsR family transcriptional regulator